MNSINKSGNQIIFHVGQTQGDNHNYNKGHGYV